jgi:hypothetical protein
METMIHFYFQGTGLQMIHDLPVLQKTADKYYVVMMEDRLTREQVIEHCIYGLTTMEQEMCDHFGDKAYDTKQVFKLWGADAVSKYSAWASCILICLKLKVFKNDEKNGISIMRVSNQVLKDMGGKEYGMKDLWQKCSNEGCTTPMGNFKKCSKCKKVRYCCRECQVADWKKHKPDCHC